MRKIILCSLFLLPLIKASAQDDCASPSILCDGFYSTGSTFGATADVSDPPLSCGDNTVNNSVWFTIEGIDTGTATISITDIDNNPGLEVEVFTGSCGGLVPVAGTCSTATGPGGIITINFSVAASVTYYIMVDGSAGDEEDFTILATATNTSITGPPLALFSTNVLKGCAPVTVQATNHSTINGGSNITYQWQVDNNAPIPATGADTSFVLTTVGAHTIYLMVCNDECGCSQFSRPVTVQEMYPNFTFLPTSTCIGSSVNFSATAVVLPATPPTNPNVSLWSWNFGDPNSGLANTGTGQSISHVFVGPGTSFTVQLTASGTCGPEMYSQVVTLLAQPTISAGANQVICEGADVTLTATVGSAVPPITYNWVGPGSFSCTNCSTTTISGLPAGGPYTISIDITDSLGCTADTTVDVLVIPKPVVNAGTDFSACQYDSVSLNALVTSGIPPYSYSWSPAAGLSNDTIANPNAFITGPVTYCVTVTDSSGCVSDPDCIDIDLYPDPTISPTIPILCASDPILQDTFIVAGAGVGSTYSWTLSPNYNLITSASVDSSSIYVTFPTGVAATYNFTVVVADAITSCVDTVSTSFTVVAGLSMSITGPSVVCLGDTITLTASGAVTYAWTANPAYSFADSTQASQTVSPAVTTTFTVVGTAGTCSQVLTRTVTVNAKPVSTIVPIPPYCGCTFVTLDGTTGSTPGVLYLWTSQAGNIISVPTDWNTTAQLCTNDVITLRVTDPVTGCFKDSSISTTQSPFPVATIAVDSDTICNGVATLINLDGTGSDTLSGTTYHWSSNNPGVTILDTSAISTSATVTGTTIFYFIVTNSQGCDSTVSDTVITFPPPSLSVTPSTLCTSDPVLQSVLSVNGSTPGSTYNWDLIPGCVTPSSSANPSDTFDFSSCGAATYNFEVVVTDIGTGCIDTLQGTVNMINGVTLAVSPDVTICEGDAAILYASGATTYLWSNGATTDTISVAGLTSAGSPYTFTVTGTTGSCNSSGVVNVFVNPIPQTDPITGPAFACQGDTGSLYIVTPSIGNYVWSITGGTITSGQNTDQVVVTWDSAGTGIISVIDSDGVGCSGQTQSMNVTLSPKPQASAVPLAPFCGCATLTLDGTGSTPGMDYEWTTLAGSVIVNPDSLITIAQVCANDIFTLTVKDLITGCSADTSIIASYSPLPAAVMNLTPNVICNGVPTLITLDGTGSDTSGTTLHWGSNNPGVIIADTTAILTTATVSGPTIFYFSVTDSVGCTVDLTDTVQIFPLPTVTATPTALCTSDPVLQSVLAVNGASPGSGYNWNIIPGCVTPSTSNNQSDTFDFSSCGAATYNFEVVVSDITTGCIDTLQTSVNLVNGVPLAVSPDDTICEGNDIIMYASGALTYLWSNGATTDTITVSGLTSGGSPYLFVCTGTIGTCTSSLSVNVYVDPVPATGPVTGPAIACQGDTNVAYTVTPSFGNYIWSVTGGIITSGQNTDQILVNWDSSGAQTVSVIDSDGIACSGPVQILNVTVNPQPQVAAAPITPFCNCATVSLDGLGSDTGMTYLWISQAGSLITSPNSSSTTATACTTDIFTLRVTDPLSGCFKDSSIAASQLPLPLTVITLTPNVLCNGNPTLITLDGIGSDTTGATLHWGSNNPGVIILDTNALTTSATVSSSTIFYFTVTNSSGCDSTVSDTVTLNVPPVLTVTPQNICASDPVQQSVLDITGSTPGSSYNWDLIPACVTPSASTNPTETFDFSSCGAGTYNFEVIVSDIGTGCTDTLQGTVNLVTGVPLVLGPDVTICEGNPAVVYASGATTYLWSNGATTDTVSISGLTAGGSPYNFTVTGSTGSCSTTGSVNIYVDPVPQTNPIIGAITVCQHDTEVVYTVTPPGGNYIWTINGGTITSGQNTDQVLVTWDSAGTESISVIDSDGIGCSGQIQTLTVSVTDAPDTITITGTDTVCQNSLITYSTSFTLGSTYSWVVSNEGTITGSSTGPSVDIQWLTPGTGIVYVVETNSSNCPGPLNQLIVTINPRPLPVLIQGNASACEGSAEILTTPASAGSTYTWIVTNGILNSVNGTGDTINVTWNVPGTGLVTSVETNSFGCISDTSNFSVQVYERPIATALPDSASICRNNSFQVFGTSNIGTIAWLTSGAGSFSDPTITSPVYTPAPTDSGYITLSMVLSAFPCSDDTARVILFVSPAPVVSITGTNNNLCFGQTDTLTASGGGTYLWTPGGSTSASIIVSPATPTDYYVSVTNTYNCTTTDSVHVNVIPPGIPTASADQVICFGDSALLSGTQQNAGGLIWSSTGNGTFLPSNTSPAVTYVPGSLDTAAGSASIFLTTTGACVNLTDTVNLSILDTPSVVAGSDTIFTIGPGSGEILPLSPVVTNASGLIWTSSGTGTFSPDATTLNATYTPSVADYDLDSIIITATTTGGCIVATDELIIEILPFIIPNVMTPYPSSPGLNDYFKIKNLPPGSHLKIWDRWGTLVFKSDNYRNDWDAANLKSETYYYVLEATNKEYHGWISVMRE